MRPPVSPHLYVSKAAAFFIAGLILAACAPQVKTDASATLTTEQTADGGDMKAPYRVSFDVETGRPIVMAMINGEGPFPFVFDTGSPGLLLQKSLANELGLEATETRAVNSPAGGVPVEMGVVRGQTISLGGALAENVEGLVMDFGGPELGAGVIGPSLFREYGPMVLDFRTNELLIGSEKNESGADAGWIAFGSSAPLLDAEITIGSVGIPAHIDTGGPHVLSVPESYAEDLPLAGPIQVIGRARTIDREFEIKGAPVAAPARLSDAEIPLSMLMFNDLPVANLGTGGLRGLVLDIDWAGERFRLSGVAEPMRMQPRRVQVERPAQED